MENIKNVKVNNSENTLSILLESGEIKKRSYRSYTYGKFKGETVFQLNSQIYAFSTDYLKNPSPYKTLWFIPVSNIRYVGPKREVFNNLEDVEVENVEESKISPIDISREVYHEKYEQIKVCVENNIPVYLVGPAGSGKNHTLEQIANNLDMNFYFTNSIQQEYKLTGFIDAGGKYQPTEFYKACVDDKECIFFLDEMDASIPESTKALVSVSQTYQLPFAPIYGGFFDKSSIASTRSSACSIYAMI